MWLTKYKNVPAFSENQSIQIHFIYWLNMYKSRNYFISSLINPPDLLAYR